MLYSFSAKSSIVFICHVDLWTISKAKSSVRKSTRADFGKDIFSADLNCEDALLTNI